MRMQRAKKFSTQLQNKKPRKPKRPNSRKPKPKRKHCLMPKPAATVRSTSESKYGLLRQQQLIPSVLHAQRSIPGAASEDAAVAAAGAFVARNRRMFRSSPSF